MKFLWPITDREPFLALQCLHDKYCWITVKKHGISWNFTGRKKRYGPRPPFSIPINCPSIEWVPGSLFQAAKSDRCLVGRNRFWLKSLFSTRKSNLIKTTKWIGHSSLIRFQIEYWDSGIIDVIRVCMMWKVQIFTFYTTTKKTMPVPQQIKIIWYLLDFMIMLCGLITNWQ